MRKRKEIIAVDFDGTLCQNKWPDIGEPNVELIDYLIGKRADDSILILWTCRVGDQLKDAINWCKDHALIFDYVNENAKEIIEQFGGTESRKIFADVYIDDRNAFFASIPFMDV